MAGRRRHGWAASCSCVGLRLAGGLGSWLDGRTDALELSARERRLEQRAAVHHGGALNQGNAAAARRRAAHGGTQSHAANGAVLQNVPCRTGERRVHRCTAKDRAPACRRDAQAKTPLRRRRLTAAPPAGTRLWMSSMKRMARPRSSCICKRHASVMQAHASGSFAAAPQLQQTPGSGQAREAHQGGIPARGGAAIDEVQQAPRQRAAFLQKPPHLVEHGLEPLLKLAGHHTPGRQAAQVQLQHLSTHSTAQHNRGTVVVWTAREEQRKGGGAWCAARARQAVRTQGAKPWGGACSAQALTLTPCSASGTSPATMRCARPSTSAVLPTPLSPISCRRARGGAQQQVCIRGPPLLKQSQGCAGMPTPLSPISCGGGLGTPAGAQQLLAADPTLMPH